MKTFEIIGKGRMNVNELKNVDQDLIFKSFRSVVEDWAGIDNLEMLDLCPDTEEEKNFIMNVVMPIAGHPVFVIGEQLAAYYCYMRNKRDGFSIEKLNEFHDLVKAVTRGFYEIEQFDAPFDMPSNIIELAMAFHWCTYRG